MLSVFLNTLIKFDHFNFDSTPELRLWREPDIHPVHYALSGQTGTAAASGHQGGLCPGRLLHRPVGPDLRGGSTFPGPQAHVKGQQEHRGAQGEAPPASVSLPPKNKAHKQQLKSAHLNWPSKKGTLELQPDGHLRMKQLEKLDIPAGGGGETQVIHF